MLERLPSFQLVAVTPANVIDPAIAIAASRAGATGILDLQYAGHDSSLAVGAITQLARLARHQWGIKLDSAAHSLLEGIPPVLFETLSLVILTVAEPEAMRYQMETLRSRGSPQLQILLEATSVEEARLGEVLGVDGVIAKGNEGGGRVGEETTFILVQHLLAKIALPVWAHGGIGLHTAGACYTAGATGVVIDSQLLLARESPLTATVKAAIARMDGSETLCLGGRETGDYYRLYYRPGLAPVEALRQVQITLPRQYPVEAERLSQWRQAVRVRVGPDNLDKNVWLLGQDACFAAPLAARFRTIGGIIEGLRHAIESHVVAARSLQPLAAGAPLAHSHGTRYPIVQGPMTRVSDRAAFAARVAEGGALPFLALALMPATEVEPLLAETRNMLGDRPWGVGILGFVPFDLRQEQLAVVQAYRPAFALIAGGRPDQALSLEAAGIATYLHVPSPGLLQLFIEGGARRFIFEGRECGGHVGPRSSFVLWNTMLDTLLETLPDSELQHCHILFAGGIHDAVSAAMVATLAAPLAERRAKIGVLLGTAYLFTDEAVESGAIVEGFRQETLQCTHTVLLETGPGHVTRCADTPFAHTFEQEKQQLLAANASADEIRDVLEKLNLGRLRIASKAIQRHPDYGKDSRAPRFATLSDAEQHAQGMYMLGQVACLRNTPVTIEALHADVATASSQRLAALADPVLPRPEIQRSQQPAAVAIVGMACLLPKAAGLQSYWHNIQTKVDAVTEVPEDRWDWRKYFDPDPKARDKIYSKWGGFLDAVPFDPLRYGMPPNSLPSIDPLQLLTLEVVRAALQDAGYEDGYVDNPAVRRQTSVILGVGGGTGDLGEQYTVRANLPLVLDPTPPEVWNRLPEWTEDSFPGILLNVVAGRVANRFDLGGVNYIVDAACASSLAAVELAVKELEMGTSDMVIVGGADTVQSPFTYLAFSKTQALSPHGRCATFDASADGIACSEGIAVLVLKRLADAERDGNRIYAVIRGVAGSSDGRAKGLTAPHPEGQVLALERAYTKAELSPATIGLIEAHGTGTVVGDQAEVETLKKVFTAAGASRQSCAIGSVKSMIGHTKCTAGVAGLIKVALALRHKVLPPTLHVETPNPEARFSESPFYVNTELRPWINGLQDYPRRAGVSAFGFGGTNFHAVLEEYRGNFLPADEHEAVLQQWPSELLLWSGNSCQEFLTSIETLLKALSQGAKPALRDLSYTLWQSVQEQPEPTLWLAMVATSLDDLQRKLNFARDKLSSFAAESGNAGSGNRIHDPRGIYFTDRPLSSRGKLAFLFPGQGSQYPDMLCDLALHFPEVRQHFEQADAVLAGCFPQHLSAYIFPPPRFTSDEQQACERALTQTNIAQPALGVTSLALLHLLKTLGIRPDLVAGHSYGEYVALCSAGVFSEQTLYTVSEARGRCIIESTAGQDLGTMAAVAERAERISDLVNSIEGVWVANINAPQQTVISGTRAGVEAAVERLRNQGIQAKLIPVACAFHSPVIAPARDRLAHVLAEIDFGVPQLPVFANATAAPYTDNPVAIATLLAEHLVSPVRFADEIEALYETGARLFVEVGPRTVLTGLTQHTLGERDYQAVAMDIEGRSSLVQLHHAVGQLATQGVAVDLNRLFVGREVQRLDLTALEATTGDKPLPATTWLVSGNRARPLRELSRVKEKMELPQQEENKLPLTAPLPAVATNQAASAPQLATRNERQAAGHLDRPVPSVTALPVDRGINVARPVSSQGIHHVMLQFQQLMNRFLQTQQDVMLGYLRTSGGGTDLLSRTEATSILVADAAAIPVAESLPAVPKAAPEVPESSDQPEALAKQAAQPLTGKEDITTKLLAMVSERTGYPPEMLDLDLNMESDLGIDSIKRVEILAAFRRNYLPPQTQNMAGLMERLAKIKTLGGIIDLIGSSLQLNPAGGDPAVTLQADETIPSPIPDSSKRETAALQSPAPRFVLEPMELPLPAQTRSLPARNVVVITDDEGGIAESLASLLRRQVEAVILVRMGQSQAEVGPYTYTTDLTNEQAVSALLQHLRQRHGSLGGIVHVLPLKQGPGFAQMDYLSWQSRLQLELNSLFYLAKAAGPDLRQVGKRGEAWFMAATSVGNLFGLGAGERRFILPSQGGAAGLIKTLALEWPEVRCKVIDFDAAVAQPSQVAEPLFAELLASDQEVELGYQNGRRLVLQPRAAPLAQPDSPQITLSTDHVILVTGGARGITGSVVRAWAERYRPTLLLVGRSPLPPAQESPETLGLTTQREIKAALMEQMRKAGQPIKPAQVEAEYIRLSKEREIRANLAAIERTGATVRYYPVDVCDEQAFGKLLDDLYQRYGRIDGVLHGAGIIEDKLIEDKTADSFERVLNTKVTGALVLSRKLRPESVKFLIFFSSVAGCFGNRGQGDYAAANEIVNKLALYLDGQWPGWIRSINWGPWDKAGMVSPEVRRQFEQRRVKLVSPLAGQEALEQELRCGRKGEVEVIIGGGPWEEAATHAIAPLPASFTASQWRAATATTASG